MAHPPSGLDQNARGPNTTRVLGVLGFFRRRSFAGLRRVLRSGPSGPSSGPSPGLRRVSRPSGSVGVLGGSFEFFSGSLAGPSPGPSPGLASSGRVLEVLRLSSVGSLAGSVGSFAGSRVRRGPSASLEGLLNFSPGPWRVLRRVLRRVSRPSSLAGSSAGLRRVFGGSFWRLRAGSVGSSGRVLRVLRRVLRRVSRPSSLAGSSAGLRRVFARSFAAGLSASLGVPRRPSASLGVPRRSLAGLSSVFRRSFSASRVFPRGLQGRALC